MNGTIQPTVELATNNGNGYPYPVMPAYANNGLFGGADNGIWGIILLALLFGNGNFGWGGNNSWNNVATTDYVSSEFTQRDINSGFQNTNNMISNGFSDISTNLCNLRSDVLTGNMGLSNAILDSKYANQLAESQTQRDILLQTTQLENQAGMNALQNQAKLDACCCELKSLIREDGEATRSLITQNTINELREKLNEAQTEISNRNIESSIINNVRPYPVPSYLVSSPYQSIYNPYSFNGFYGNGFYGNTIV